MPTPDRNTHPNANRASGETLPELFSELPFALRIEPPGLDLSGLTDIQWRDERCTRQSILCFQRFDDGRSDAELYQRYLAGGRFGALITNRPLDCFDQLKDTAVYVTAPGAWGATLERLCDHFYPLAPGHWRMAGVTGTNGKTTTVKYLESILTAAGRRVLSIGTLGLALDGEPLGGTGFTSPPYIELRRILHALQDRADTLVMEVSSHALHQGRVHGLQLEAAAWTNFSQDHLDYHGNEEHYFAAKAGILDLLAEGTPLLTTSGDVAQRLRRLFGDGTPVQQLDPVVIADDVLEERPFLALDYNRANYTLALAMARRLLGEAPAPGLAPTLTMGLAQAWQALTPVDGRFECHVHGQRRIVIDFAHTPDALENVLGAIRTAFPSARILTLFGCGGDRDRSKRPLMGAAVCRWSDRVIVTSDNPRFEDPRAIIDDTRTGMSGCPVSPEVVVDRADAIRRLFDFLAEQPEDAPWVALIAGKGHERYIDQNGHKRNYSDQDEVARNLRRLGWTA